MKLKFGMIVTDGRGKLGGHVLSKNRAGAYARTKVTPVNPQTSYQTIARALFGAISQAWSGFTVDIIAQWNAAVVDWQKTDIFGDLRSPSGKALFQRLNNQAQSAGWGPVLVAPARAEMPVGIVVDPEFDLSLSALTLPQAVNVPEVRIMLFATPMLSLGTKFVKNQLRLVGTFDSSTYSATAGATAYINKFGVPLADANVKIGVKYVLENGQASPMQVVGVTVIN